MSLLLGANFWIVVVDWRQNLIWNEYIQMVAAAAGRLAGGGPIQISWLTSPASQFITAEQSQSIINRLPVVASDDLAENFTELDLRLFTAE